MVKIKTLFLLGLLGSVEALANPWAQVTQPVNVGGIAQSIGTYDAGCLSGAVSLPADGVGYQVMRPSRHRFYGHPELKQVIETLGRQAAAAHLGVLLIGDLGQPRGGPTPSGHRSHQTGLDVDIWFLLSAQAANRSLTWAERENLSAPSMLASKSDAVDDSLWSRANDRVLELAAELPAVDRIFVNPGIKRELCSRYKGQRWLQKIRPWWKHDDHFHVRLKCPANNKNCQGQPPLPAGDGCDAGLAWWFSDEAKKPPAKPYKPKEPVLPALCNTVLRQ